LVGFPGRDLAAENRHLRTGTGHEGLSAIRDLALPRWRPITAVEPALPFLIAPATAAGSGSWDCRRTAIGRASRAPLHAERVDDDRFSSFEGRLAHSRELTRLLDEVFGSRTPADWESAFESESIWWEPVHSIEEVADDDQTAATRAWVETDAGGGRTHRVASLIDFDDAAPVATGPFPESGQYTEEVLLELGYKWEGIAERRRVGALPRADGSGSTCPERACSGERRDECRDAADGKTKTRSKRCSKSTEA